LSTRRSFASTLRMTAFSDRGVFKSRAHVFCPERASLAVTKSAHVRFVLRDPGGHFLRGELTWVRQARRLLGPKPGGEEEQQLLLLFRRQGVGGGLDLRKCAHEERIATI